MSDKYNIDEMPLPGVVEPNGGIYPGLSSFSGLYNAQDYASWVDASNGDPVPAPLVIYIQGAGDRNQQSVRNILVELDLQSKLFDPDRPVRQLILTGPMTVNWTDNQLYRLVFSVQKLFPVTRESLKRWCVCFSSLTPNGARLDLFRKLGFSSVRLAVDVSEGHSYRTFERLCARARDSGITQLTVDAKVRNADHAALTNFSSLLSKVCPDRICLELAQHLPADRFRELLLERSYVPIGLHWFVRLGDIWLNARDEGRLRWSPLGFTDTERPDVVGVGPGTVSAVGDAYSCNHWQTEFYEKSLSVPALPVAGGVELESGDILRREIMTMILTHGRIDLAAIEEKWGIEFKRFFRNEFQTLEGWQRAGLVERCGDGINITESGQEQLENLCSLFDVR